MDACVGAPDINGGDAQYVSGRQFIGVVNPIPVTPIDRDVGGY